MARGKRHTLYLAALKKSGEYERLVARRGAEECWICEAKPKGRKLSIDHSHKRMFPRGLLCFRCNRLLEDWVTPKWLRDAADYLEASESSYDAYIDGKGAA